MGSKKTTTTTHSQGSLPDWLTTPYQQATKAATNLYDTQPGIGAGTQASLDQIVANANAGRTMTNGALNTLNNFATGNFGQPALTGAANGSYLSSNPWANGGQPITTSSALNGFAANGLPTSVSGALNGFAGNGGLDTGYIDQSLLNQSANGSFLTPDSNPFIKSVASQAADAAQARINAQFGSAGRSNGSGLYAQLFGQGITNATDQVYAQNYENERQRQLAAQNTLLNSQQAAREAALARQFGAQGDIFNAENSSAENAAQRQYGAASSIFGAQNSAAENAAARASTAYEAERQRQQLAANGLIDSQLQASGQLPGLLQSIMNGDIQAFTSNQYQDNAPYNNLQKYVGLLSQLSAPFPITDSKTTTKTTPSTLDTISQAAQLGASIASAVTGNPFAALFNGNVASAAGGKGGGINYNPASMNAAANKFFGGS